MRDWAQWSRAAWSRHVGEVAGDDFVAGLGEATIQGLAHATAVQSRDKAAVSIDGHHVTHGQLDERAARAAAWVKARAATGDRVVLAAPPSLDWIACYLGILRAGCIAVLANPANTAPELDQLAAAAESSLSIADPAEALDAEPIAWTDEASPDSIALLAFTSGTTGRPKGVPLTHRQLLTSIRAAMAAWRWSGADVLVHALPLFHQHGLGGLHATLITGSTLHLLPRFDADLLLAEIDRANATVLMAVPTMYQRLNGARAHRNRLRLCISGSAPLSRTTAEIATSVLGQAPLVRYGTTETGLNLSHVYAEARDTALAETVGAPLPGVELRLAADDELQLRGPQVFAGYWRDEAATREAFTDDGWFRTGDLGQLDEVSGQIAITGRSKEMIITGGMKVMPREVELVLERHPSIAEAAVAGVPSEQWGEEVTAWVVVRGEATFDAGALIAHVRSSLAAYKTPKHVFRVDSLPRNAVGKLDRKRLLTA